MAAEHLAVAQLKNTEALTDTNVGAFLILIRMQLHLSKRRFLQEKHFNTASIMTHLHVGICVTYATSRCDI